LFVSVEEYGALLSILSRFESEKKLTANSFIGFYMYSTLSAAVKLLSSVDIEKISFICSYLKEVENSEIVKSWTEKKGDGKSKKAGKVDKKKSSSSNNDINSSTASLDTSDIVKPVLTGIDWEATGLMSSLKRLFDAAIAAAFPEVSSNEAAVAVITRCANATFGDFQCNNAMALSKILKVLPGYKGPSSPKDVATRIVAALPENPIIGEASPAPNGFINIKVAVQLLLSAIAGMVTGTALRPPTVDSTRKKVLVDFSSPNIAKEMHVGHLRSTIIGDCLCRVFEFVGFDVMRVNHVGDWGTQFGMLISYLQDTYPTILTDPPNISDLTVIYKASKARFDSDEVFKERSRLNVVKLQSRDPACRAIWTLLCNISRAEFQNVYDVLGVKITEFGESFYNGMIPRVNQELQDIGLAKEEEGMLVIKLPHFTIPLMIRKSDGGYGYDSTDMAALQYRIKDLQRDWIIIITDAGQAPHFHMCFDAGKAAGWTKRPAEAGGDVRVDHIGFGVVCGDDGKRFKTRSSETVRLIDLLNAAKERMAESLRARAEEGKCPLNEEELVAAASVIGYGAVKYFDLKQHPSTNYIFSYDRMLDTKGDTAVYLLFAYARLASILRKAKEERGIDISIKSDLATSVLNVDHPAERALSFELLQFGDVLQLVMSELMPNKMCDYLKELAVKFTEFVTKCHVLNATGKVIVDMLITGY